MFDSLLGILECPQCRRTLEVMDSHTGLRCPHCRMVYPIRDEIPVLASEAAVPLAAWRKGARRPDEGVTKLSVLKAAKRASV